MLALLEQFDQIFQHCLDPQEDATFDHQMGIRKYPNSILPLDFWSNIRCVGRMTRLYALPKKKTSLFGHKATSILFHRPLGQVRSYIFPQIYSILWLFFILLYYYCSFLFFLSFFSLLPDYTHPMDLSWWAFWFARKSSRGPCVCPVGYCSDLEC